MRVTFSLTSLAILALLPLARALPTRDERAVAPLQPRIESSGQNTTSTDDANQDYYVQTQLPRDFGTLKISYSEYRGSAHMCLGTGDTPFRLLVNKQEQNFVCNPPPPKSDDKVKSKCQLINQSACRAQTAAGNKCLFEHDTAKGSDCYSAKMTKAFFNGPFLTAVMGTNAKWQTKDALWVQIRDEQPMNVPKFVKLSP